LNNVIKGKNNLKPMPPRADIDELTVLSNSHLMPGALIEIGFLNNRGDVKTISETGYAKIAQYVGDAIITWYNENKSTN
jgi:N-acetylmuramoyl-L-alanine amidase